MNELLMRVLNHLENGEGDKDNLVRAIKEKIESSTVEPIWVLARSVGEMNYYAEKGYQLHTVRITTDFAINSFMFHASKIASAQQKLMQESLLPGLNLKDLLGVK